MVIDILEKPLMIYQMAEEQKYHQWAMYLMDII